MGGTFDMASEPRVGLVRRFALLERNGSSLVGCTLLGPEGPGTGDGDCTSGPGLEAAGWLWMGLGPPVL